MNKKPEIIYVTGCDSKYFLMTAVLLQAFKRRCPGRRLWVCDFGLIDKLQNILSDAGILLKKPPALEENQHPWVYKANLLKYVASLNPDIVVWLDSDCFPVGPFADDVEKIIGGKKISGNTIAICRGKVGKTWEIASPESNRRFFNIPSDCPYYNSGVWILSSVQVLQSWAQEILFVPRDGMFEQDLFNSLLHKYKTRIVELDSDTWNVTHEQLNTIDINSHNRVIVNGKQSLIMHVTGSYTPLKLTAGPFTGFIKALNNQILQKMQVDLLNEWVNDLTKMPG